jgi:hypothetical protein
LPEVSFDAQTRYSIFLEHCPMSASQTERRRYARCQIDVGMTLTLLNKTDEYAILTKNYSRCGIYFETKHNFKRGAMIVLRPIDCEHQNDRSPNAPLPFFCTGALPVSKACRELRFPTVARVTRCHKLEIPGRERYGVAADNLRLTD